MNKKKKILRKQDRKLEKLLETIESLEEEVEATELEDASSFPPPNENDSVDEADDGSTAKYDEDKHLTPKQGKSLPDKVQKAIIDKEKKKREQKNESIVRGIVRRALKNRR